MRFTVALVAGVAQGQVLQSSEPPVEPAQADNAMLFVVSNRVNSGSPSCTVLVEALWQPGDWQFLGAAFDVFADADSGGFESPERLLKGPGTKDGEVEPSGDAVTGILSGQLCSLIDPPCGILPCPNPQPLWQATWITDDFTPRIIALSTVTEKFETYFDINCISESYIDVLAEGAGQIVITCYADCDQSTGLGVLDIFDFLCYVNEFNSGSVGADCSHDGVFDLFDFVCFINEFNNGC